MEESRALTVRETGVVMPVMSVEQAVQRYKATAKLVSEAMEKDRDYGIIPGTGNKPTLLKPGAEKLTTFFGLRSKFVLLDKLEDWDAGRFMYRYACELWSGDMLIASTEASANSLEKKYRWRSIYENKATADDKRMAVRTETRNGSRGQYKVYILENDDPYSLVNTLQKMAQKRALIGSTLVAVNASDFFTQDIEDMADGAIEGTFRQVDPEPEPEPAQQPKQNAPKAGKAEPKPERPYDPETLRAGLRVQIAKLNGLAASRPTTAQFQLLRYAIELATGGGTEDAKTQNRHLVLDYLLGKTSSKDVNLAECKALLDVWLKPEKDEDGQYSIEPDYTPVEAKAIIQLAQIEAGQETLFDGSNEGAFGAQPGDLPDDVAEGA